MTIKLILSKLSTSGYPDDCLNIANTSFEGTVNQIYQPEQLLNKANTTDIEAPFFYLHLSTSTILVQLHKANTTDT